MRGLVTAGVALLLANSGCAATIDAAYAISDKRYTEYAGQSQRLPQTIDRVEYEIKVEPDASMHVTCFARTRQLERTWSVIKTYRYRNGYDKGVYIGAAVFDAVFGGAFAGVALHLCTDEDPDLSCWNLLYMSPYALDIGYAVIRYLTVSPPVLIDKSSTEDSLRIADEPVHEQATACESLASLWLGSATGPDDLSILTGRADGNRSLEEGALEIVLDPTRTIALTPEVAERWALNTSLNLVVVDRDGVAHYLHADRCALLRPVRDSLSADAQAVYQRDCEPKSNVTTPSDGEPSSPSDGEPPSEGEPSSPSDGEPSSPSDGEPPSP